MMDMLDMMDAVTIRGARERGAVRDAYIRPGTGPAVRDAGSGAPSVRTDTVEIGGDAAYLERLRERPPGMRLSIGTAPARGADPEDGDPVPEKDGEEAESAESASGKGRIGINAARIARQLAAAKTRSQVRAVIAELRQDLQECEDGAAQGLDVDEASVEAAERLLGQARSRLGQAEDREPTPAEDLASALASLM